MRGAPTRPLPSPGVAVLGGFLGGAVSPQLVGPQMPEHQEYRKEESIVITNVPVMSGS